MSQKVLEVEDQAGEIARLREETVEYGRLLSKSSIEISQLEMRERRLLAKNASYFELMQKGGQSITELEERERELVREVAKWREACGALETRVREVEGLLAAAGCANPNPPPSNPAVELNK